MQKNSLRAVAAMTILFSTVLLGACAPKFVGEAAAKEAGLTLLRQAFGTNAKDAHVEYFERAGTSAVDNTEVQPGSKTPTQIYLVTISDQTLGTDLYYAEVDAKTGVAYYATKNEWLLAPQNPNQNQPTQENTTPKGTDTDESAQDESAESTACAFVMRRFQKEVSLITSQGGLPSLRQTRAARERRLFCDVCGRFAVSRWFFVAGNGYERNSSAWK